MSYSWVRAGERKRIPYENPQGRRLNVLAALVPVPSVVVLDNAAILTSHRVRATRSALRARRTFLYYLPPSSPELNDIERLFRAIKYDDLPERRYPTILLLDRADRQAFTTAEERLLAKHDRITESQQEPGRVA